MLKTMNNKPIIIYIEWIKIIIEKGEVNKDNPNNLQHQIQYHPLDIKRKYYKKGDPEYHRKPIKKTNCLKTKSCWFDKIVKQEPLLDLH